MLLIQAIYCDKIDPYTFNIRFFEDSNSIFHDTVALYILHSGTHFSIELLVYVSADWLTVCCGLKWDTKLSDQKDLLMSVGSKVYTKHGGITFIHTSLIYLEIWLEENWNFACRLPENAMPPDSWIWCFNGFCLLLLFVWKEYYCMFTYNTLVSTCKVSMILIDTFIV